MKRFMIRKALMYFLCICIMMSVGYTGNVTSAAAESPAAQPALVNPGFELPVVGESIPGWSKTLGTTGSVSVTSALFRSGASSLKIFDNDAVSFNVESDRMEVTAGNEYLASAWWYLEQTPNPSAQMQIKFYDSSNNLVPNSTAMNSQTFSAGGPNLWQRFAVKAVAPPAATSAAIVMITGTAAKGNAYIDDVSFERVISTVTNPLRNAGLEEDVAGGIPGWAPMFGGAGTNGSVTVDKTKYYSGTSSLKLDDQDTTVLFGAISDKIAVTPNTNYSASAAVLATGGSIQIQLRFFTSTGAATTAPTSVYEQTVHSAGWQPISVSSVAPSNAAFAAIVIASPTARSGKGTSYWDDFKIEELKQPIAAEEPPLGTFAALQNPSFELPMSDGFVQHWKSLNGTQGIAQDVNTKLEGAQSLKLDNPSSQLLGVMSNYVTVNAGRNQTVSAMVYGTGVAAAEIQLNFYDQANQLLDQANQTLTPAIGSWTKLSVTKAAPANTVTIAVVLKNSGQGTLYYDQVGWTEEIPPAPPAPKYFVPNGGFEAPTTGSNVPNWKVNSGLASVSSLEKKEGQQSLFVSNVKTTGAGINMESELIDVQEGATYRLGTQFYLETGALEGLYVYVYDQAGKIVKSADAKDFHTYLSALTPAGEWAYTEKLFTVQPGGVKLKISLISGNKKTYSYYLDDISITKVVNNGDFEQAVVDNVITGWSKYAPATDGSTFGITGDMFKTGTKSMYIQNEPGKFLNVISNLIEVEPGAVYTALADTFIDYGSADMYVRYFDKDKKYLSKQAWSIKSDPAGSWFTNTVTAEVPAEAAYAAVMFAGSANKTFKYYVDNVRLLKGTHIVAASIPENSIVKVAQDVGVQIRNVTLMRGDTGKDSNGRDVIYSVAVGVPAIFTVIDIETQQVVKSMPMPDVTGAWSVTVADDGTVYLGGYNLGLLYRYFPATGELKNLGHPLPTKDSVLYPMANGKDGKMYGSTYPTANLYEYDPVTNKFTDFGTLSAQNSGERWTRVVVYDPDTHKVYAGVGNQARLVEYDIATGVKKDLLPSKYSNIISVYDLNLVGGKLFAKKEANNANEMFVLNAATGEQIEVTNADTGAKMYDVPMFSRGVSPKSPIANKIYYAAAAGALYSYDLDTDTIQSLGASIDGAAIGYDFVQLQEEGFPGYSMVGLTGNGGKMYKYNLQTGNVKVTEIQIPAEPVNIHDIEKGPDGKIYTSGYLSGNVGVHSPSSGQSMYLNGLGQQEGITVIGNKIYYGLYPDAKIYEYDLSKPWNRTNSDKLNPVVIFDLKENAAIPGYTLQDRPFGMAGSEDMNKLFVGTVPKNGLLGGVLAVYDLNTRGKPDVYWNLVPNQSIISLVYKDGKLYGGSSIHGGQGGTPIANEAVLFVWDVASKQIEHQVVPVAGKQAITALHIGPDGNIWGLANGALFVYDPAQKQVIYSKNEFPDASGRWIDGSMETGTDGNVYATVAGRFFKVDAATKAVSVLATQVKKLAQDDFGSFYLYRDPEGPNLYKYSDPNLVVKLTGAELTVPTTNLKVGEHVPVALKGILEKGRTTKELSGAVVTYTISDPTSVTIANGQIEAKRSGIVQVIAHVTMADRSVQSNSITLNISGIATSISVDNAVGVYSDVSELRAVLKTAEGDPITGMRVEFTVAGQHAGDAVTDVTGTAVVPYVVSDSIGSGSETTSLNVRAVFIDPAAYYEGSSAEGTLTISKEEVAIEYTGELVQPTSGSVMLTAKIVQQADGMPGIVTGLPVRFEAVVIAPDGSKLPYTSDALRMVYTAAADGVVTASLPLPEGVYAITAKLDTNGYYKTASSMAATVAVFDPSRLNTSVKAQLDLSAGNATIGVNAKKLHVDLDVAYDGAASKAVVNGRMFATPQGISLTVTGTQWAVVTDAGLFMQFTASDETGAIYTVQVTGANVKDGNNKSLHVKIWNGIQVNVPPAFEF